MVTILKKYNSKSRACDFMAFVQQSINYIHVSAGIYESPSFWSIASTYIPARQLIPLTSQMKKAVNIPFYSRRLP